jgi:hypothetical protein
MQAEGTEEGTRAMRGEEDSDAGEVKEKEVQVAGAAALA